VCRQSALSPEIENREGSKQSMKKIGRGLRRFRKVLWALNRIPTFVDNHGVLLPTKQPGISEGIRKQIFFSDYEAKEVEIVSRRLESHDVVMEVGAGIGFLSALCAQRIGSERVFAYEANPSLMPVIRTTHEANGVSPTVHNVLLAKGEGVRTFYVEDEFWASSAVGGSSNAKAIEVRQADLNTEIAAISPTFLIVDIEGGEIEFFATVDLSKVRKICVETHPGVLTDAQLSDMFRQIFAQGFALDFSLIRKNVFYLYRP